MAGKKFRSNWLNAERKRELIRQLDEAGKEVHRPAEKSIEQLQNILEGKADVTTETKRTSSKAKRGGPRTIW